MLHNYKAIVFVSLSFIFMFMFMFSSCELYNPSEPIPAYLHIDKIDLTTYSGQGTNSNKITDAWVYIDEQLLGCFELPATFPVLVEGAHAIKIRPGIKVNGISATRSPYPFYTIYDTVVSNLQKGVVTKLTPKVTYRSNITFSFMEDFEGAGVIINKSPAAGVDTVIQILNQQMSPYVFEGQQCGIVYLDKTHTFFEGVSSTSYILPKGGTDVFLEFNYMCNHQFVTGVYAHSPAGSYQSEALTLNPSSTWNKAYVYLTRPISENGNATDFSIFFGMRNTTGSDSLALLIDNIKLIY